MTKTKKDEKKLDFHSFRATFIDTAKQLSLPLSQVHEIVGHTEDRALPVSMRKDTELQFSSMTLLKK